MTIKNNENSPYEILGVSKNSSLKEIKLAFRRKAKVFHPDVNPDDEDSTKNFIKVMEAYEILKNKVNRRKHHKYITIRREQVIPEKKKEKKKKKASVKQKYVEKYNIEDLLRAISIVKAIEKRKVVVYIRKANSFLIYDLSFYFRHLLKWKKIQRAIIEIGALMNQFSILSFRDFVKSIENEVRFQKKIIKLNKEEYREIGQYVVIPFFHPLSTDLFDIKKSPFFNPNNPDKLNIKNLDDYLRFKKICPACLSIDIKLTEKGGTKRYECQQCRSRWLDEKIKNLTIRSRLFVSMARKYSELDFLKMTKFYARATTIEQQISILLDQKFSPKAKDHLKNSIIYTFEARNKPMFIKSMEIFDKRADLNKNDKEFLKNMKQKARFRFE